ncbi:MAG: hypothetical protein K8G79_05155 [bacterium]|uniref:Uncharacterized protein n=1 Tax=Candidatus Methylomirabilis tolerans TaxID=3123416 RepID=A0AAJ1AHY2_9BACT|nr:hypothetical protein [Candidatus Methylomirabilis sp.]
MLGTEFYSDLLVYTRLMTIGFTMWVLGGICMALFVMPRWQERETARTKETEAARAVKPTPVTGLPQAA